MISGLVSVGNVQAGLRRGGRIALVPAIPPAPPGHTVRSRDVASDDLVKSLPDCAVIAMSGR